MPTETTLLTLLDMQRTAPADLRAIALASRNREYSKTCEAMANAMDAHALGDSVSMRQYVEAAKRSHARAQEDEHGRVLRVRQVSAVIASAVRS